MANTIQDLMVKLGLQSDGIMNGLDQVQSKTSGFASRMTGLLSGISFAGFSISAVAASEKFAQAAAQMQRATGATGDKLKGLEDSFANVYKQTTASSEAVASTLAMLSTRTQATGKDLEDLTLKTIKLARTQNEDATVVVPLVTRVFGDWSIATNKQGQAMDYLRVVSQQTGTQVSRLSEQAVSAGAPLRQLGYSFEQAVALIGKFDKEGVNTELVLGGMKGALQKFSKEGITDTAAAWKEFVEGVKNGSITLQDVMKEVGTKRGVDLYKAIQEGRFEIEKTVETYKQLETQGGQSIESLRTKMTKFTHEVEAAIAPHRDLILAISSMGPAFVGVMGLAKSAGESIAASGLVAQLGWAPFIAVMTAVTAGIVAAVNAWEKFQVHEVGKGTKGGTFTGFGFTPSSPAPPTLDFKPPVPKAPEFAFQIPHPSGGGGGGTLTDEEYKLAKIQIDAAAAHAKAMLEIKKSGYEEDERMGKANAQETMERMLAVNAEELRITLDAISKKEALQREHKEDEKDLMLESQRTAARDKAFAEALKIEQHYQQNYSATVRQAIADTKAFNETMGSSLTPLQYLAMKTGLASEANQRFADGSGDLAAAMSKVLEPASKSLSETMTGLADALRKADQQALDTSPYAARAEALRYFGITSKETYDQIAKDSQDAYNKLKNSGLATDTELTIAHLQMLQAFADADRAYGRISEDVWEKITNDIKEQLDKIDGKHKQSAENRKKIEHTLGEDLKQEWKGIFEGFERGLANSIIHWKGFSDTLKKLGDDLASSMLTSFLKGLFKPLENELEALGKKVGDVFGKIWKNAGSGAPSAGGGGPSIPSGGGGGGGGGGIGGGAGLAGTVTAIGSAVSAVSNVIGNIQQAHANNLLGEIEVSTRGALNEALNFRRDQWDQWGKEYDRLGEIWNSIRESGANLFTRLGEVQTALMHAFVGGANAAAAAAGGGTITLSFSNCTFSGNLTQQQVNDMMTAAMRQAALAGGG